MKKRMRLWSFMIAPLLMGLAGDAFGGQTRVVVLCLHDDPGAAAEAQQRFEALIGVAPQIVLLPAVLAPESFQIDTERAEVEALLVKVRDAYWADDRSFAEASLADAATRIDKMGAFTAFDRSQITLWQIALLAKHDETSADAEASKLLRLAPNIQVDLAVFPPSVEKRIERIRNSLPRPVSINITGLREGARAWIDGRPADPKWEVLPGSHRLHVEAAGFRTRDEVFTASGDRSVSAALAPALPPRLASALVSFARGGDLGQVDRQDAWGLVFRSKADALIVFARDGAGLRARVFRAAPDAPSGIVGLNSPGERSLTEWVVRSIAQPPRAATAVPSTPSSPKTDFAGGVVRTGLSALNRTWRLKSADGNFKAAFAGAGVSLTAEARRKSAVGLASASFVDFGSRRRTFELRDGAPASAVGGTGVSLRFGGGARLARGKGSASPSLTATLGGAFDRRAAARIEDAVGDLELMPSWQRFGVEIGGQGELPLMIRGFPVALRVKGSAMPWGDWRTVPERSLGSPHTYSGFAWGAASSVGLPHRWTMGVEYSGALDTFTFTGTGSAPVEPTLRRVTASERTESVQLSVGKEF